MFIFLFFLGVLFSLNTTVMAWTDVLPKQFLVQAEFLYFFPSYEDTYFVINGAGVDGLGNPTPNGKRVNNSIGYNPGFRLEGAYGFCNPCVDLRLRWTHLYSRAKHTVSNTSSPELWPTEIIPSQPNIAEPFSGAAVSSIGLMYQKGEILFDEKLWDLYCLHFYLREGIEWSYIRYHESILYTDIDASNSEKIQYHGHTKGLGPQLGIIALWEPWKLFSYCPKNISLKLLATTSLIVANSKAKLKNIDIFGTENRITQNSFWKVVSEWTVNLGLNYKNYLFSVPVCWEFGYEITTYISGVSKLIFDEAASPGHSFNRYTTFYVHGFYGSLGILF